ncbi:response regulator [Promicromonospora citrea]|uniref:DNA-binding response regulator n=1 Tax=Promicromonospora citrea TaxID=43677 RepID=A0A8H9L2D3_9MICO|nr:response regulator transcription factor [Promicromonospora citrea]NNH52586.1 response regulator transcription factor [Promicromonospora citrea]GGM21215.1 DNA-binding response regulator [Promicromonospora citrea]
MTGRPNSAVRVLVVDDQPLIRHSLRLVVGGAADLAVVGEAGTGREAVERALELRPDVVLMDIRMTDGDGIEATRQIAARAELGGTRVLVLSMFELDEYVHAALRAGASGFLLKDAEPDRLVDAVRRTHAGESLFAPSILTRLVEHYLDRGPTHAGAAGTPPGLTARETEVLLHVGKGLSNTEIARTLTISMGTVKSHVGSLLAKLQARDRAQLVIAAYEHGLVGPAARP